MSPIRFQEREPPAIKVQDVGQGRVEYLRAIDWMTIALRSFRERPVPASYSTEVKPVFDVFGNARIEEVQFEEVLGTLGDIEVLSSQVAATDYRYYLSFSYQHDDLVAVNHRLQAVRVVSAGGTFPAIPIANEEREGVAPAGIAFAVRNVTVPPEGRIGARVEAIAVGARITLRSLFIDFPIGEPTGDIT